VLGFALNPRVLCPGELAEWLNPYKEPFALKCVRPNTRDRAINEDYGGYPALVAVDALVVLCAQQMILLVMSEQIGIEEWQQANRAFCRSAAVENL
jgi:hypothetical protein